MNIYTTISHFLFSSWFWFSIFTSSYLFGLIVFFEDDLNINSLVLSGVPKDEAIEGRKLIKEYQDWVTVLIGCLGYIPMFLLAWIPIIHIHFFFSVSSIVFCTDIDAVEAKRIKAEEEAANKKQEVLDLFNEIQGKLDEYSKNVKVYPQDNKNDSEGSHSQKNIGCVSKNTANNQTGRVTGRTNKTKPLTEKELKELENLINADINEDEYEDL